MKQSRFVVKSLGTVNKCTRSRSKEKMEQILNDAMMGKSASFGLVQLSEITVS